jgi:acetyltransferase EpsM
MVDTHPKPLLILGTRTFAVDVADLAADISSYELRAFVENLDPEICKRTLEGLPVLWVDDLSDLKYDPYAVCGLSTTFRSQFTNQVAAMSIQFATLVHPSAQVSVKSKAGEGTIISRSAVVAAHAELGRHVIVNRGAMIGHHSRIGSYTSIQPGANIAGACTIGEAAYIGIGAIVIDKINVGEHSVVGAGAVVTKDVPAHTLVVGVPAKVVKENISGK